MGEALAALHRRCDRVRFLGSYPRAAGRNGAAAGRRRAGRSPARHRRRGASPPRQRWLAGLRSGERRREARSAPGTAARRRNVGPLLDSRPPGAPLDELGRAQADGSAGGWPTTRSRAVYASRAIRAQQTAAPVAAAHGLAVDGARRRARGVRRRPGGPLRRRRRWRRSATSTTRGGAATWTPGCPGGESALDLRATASVPGRASDGTRDGARAATVVLVSHGAAIRLAAAALLGDTAETWYVPNTGLVVLRPTPGGWALETGTRPRRCAGTSPAARRAGTGRTARSAPAQPVQGLLVDAEVVRHLVHHGHRDLVHHLVLVRADVQDRVR